MIAEEIRNACLRATKTILIDTAFGIVWMNDSVKGCLEGPVSQADGYARRCCDARAQ